MRYLKRFMAFYLVAIISLTSVFSSYSIDVRADTRTVESQRQSIINRCVELENQYTNKTVSEYTLLYNLRLITELGMYVKLIDKEESLKFNASEKAYYCEKYKTLVEKFNSMYSQESSKYKAVKLSTENYYYENIKENLINIIPGYLEKSLGEVQRAYDNASDSRSKEKVLKTNTVLLSNIYKIIITYQDVQKDLTNLTPLNKGNTSKVFSIVEGETKNESAKTKINAIITKYSKILTVGKEAYEENLKSIDLSVSDTEDYITELCDAEMYKGQVVTKESYALKGAYFAILAASGTYVPLQSYAGNDTFTKSLIKLAENETTAKNLLNLYNNTKDYRKPLYKRSIDSNGNPTGTAKLITISEFFKDIEEGNSGALVAVQGKLKYSTEANAWVYYKDELTDTVTTSVQESFNGDDNTNTTGQEINTQNGNNNGTNTTVNGAETPSEITIEYLENCYVNGGKPELEMNNKSSIKELQNLLIDLVETKEDYEYAQKLKASSNVINPLKERFESDCEKIKTAQGIYNFENPNLTDSIGTILAKVLHVRYQKIKLTDAIDTLQLATYTYAAFSEKTGRACYDTAKTYLLSKPITIYINGLNKLYGGNGVTTDNARSYTETAVQPSNKDGIFAYTGALTKNCITISSKFDKKKVEGYSKSKDYTFNGVGTKYKYTIARYKENGFYYPENSKKTSGNLDKAYYNFNKCKQVVNSRTDLLLANRIDSVVENIKATFKPVIVNAEPVNDNTGNETVDNGNGSNTNANTNTNTNTNTVTDEDNQQDTSEMFSDGATNADKSDNSENVSLVESEDSEKVYDLDKATYTYDEITDENILTQPLLFYSTEYARAVDNTTTMLMRNILKNASSLSVIKSKSSRFLYMNCYGDIVTDDNLVILPGAANPLLYSDDTAYNPYTVAFMNNYPNILTNSENLQFSSKNDIGKYVLMANTTDEDYTDADITGYLVNGNKSVDDTSEIMIPKLQREFFANGEDSLDILSTGRYAVGSYQTWKDSDLYEWSTIAMKKTPTVDDQIIFPYVPQEDVSQTVAATITSNLFTYYTKDATNVGSASKLNDNYICHNFIFCNSNGTNNPVGYAKNFQLQYDTYVKNTLERFTTQLIDLSHSLVDKITYVDGVLGLKNTYTDPILGNVLGLAKQMFLPFMVIMGIIFLIAFMKMRRDLFETTILTAVSLVIIYLFVNVIPVYLPLAYNSVINNVSEVLSYQILGTSAEINDVEDKQVSSVTNNDYNNQTTSLTLYKVSAKDLDDFADSLNVEQDALLGGKKYLIDQAAGLYAEGDKLKINADILFDTLPITGSYDEGGEGTYTIKATKTVSNNLDYYTPYYQIVDGFINNLNALAKIYDIPRKTTTYAESTVKDSYFVYSFINSPVFVTPGNYEQGEVEETNVPEDEQAENQRINANIESALTEKFGSGTDYLGIGDLVYNLNDDAKKTLWAQTMRKNGYYNENWEPNEEKLNSLVVYVNYQTKKFIYDMEDQIGSMSDDVMIKLISLRALVAFTQEVSEYGNWLYPYCINYNEFTLGDIVKCVYTSDYNEYINLDMDIVNYIGNDLGWFHLIIFDMCIIMLYVVVNILKVLVSVLYIALAVLVIVKLFTQNDIKAPITGYFKCNVIIFSLFTILSFCIVGVSKLNGSPIALYITLFVLLFVVYILANLLRSLTHFTDLGNETINAKITGIANHVPFGRNYNENIVVNTADVNYHGDMHDTHSYGRKRDDYWNTNLYNSYRMDTDVDGYGGYDEMGEHGDYGSYNNQQVGSYHEYDDSLFDGIHDNSEEN